MKISIKIKRCGERGLHAYFSKSYFKEGQEIMVEVPGSEEACSSSIALTEDRVKKLITSTFEDFKATELDGLIKAAVKEM